MGGRRPVCWLSSDLSLRTACSTTHTSPVRPEPSPDVRLGSERADSPVGAGYCPEFGGREFSGPGAARI